MGIMVSESQGFPMSAEELARRIEIDVLPVLRSDKRMPARIVNAIVHAANRLTMTTRGADGPIFKNMPGDGEEITVADFFNDIRVIPDKEMKRRVAEIKSKSDCKHAEKTTEPYNRNAPCRGKKIHCHHPEAPEGHFSSSSNCRPERCKLFEGESNNESPRTF